MIFAFARHNQCSVNLADKKLQLLPHLTVCLLTEINNNTAYFVVHEQFYAKTKLDSTCLCPVSRNYACKSIK